MPFRFFKKFAHRLGGLPGDDRSRFRDLALPAEILRAVDDLGFHHCTPVQAQTLPHALEGRDVTGRAQTGTGKTAAFLIAVFTRFLREESRSRPSGAPRALVLGPTRELVVQIAHDAEQIGRHCRFSCVALYGGMGYDKQQADLARRPVDLVVATPGRLLDFMSKGVVDLRHVEVLVIDEADRMLDMGFIPDVRRIVRSLPDRDNRQTLLFSATLTEDVRRLASQWMKDPVVVEVEPQQVAVDTVRPVVYTVAADRKMDLLYNLLQQPAMERVLVFVNRRDRAERVVHTLKDCGVVCSLLSGAVPQSRRLRIIEDFRGGKTRVVVATDVAGRGLHIENISHVVNYDLPYEPEDYVHRIGRTGRAGALGTAISFACEDESFILPDIERYIGRALACVQPEEALLTPPPGRRETSGRPTRPPRRPYGRSDRRGRFSSKRP